MFGETFTLNGKVEITLHDKSGTVFNTIKQNTVVEEGMLGFLSSLGPEHSYKVVNFYLWNRNLIPAYTDPDPAVNERNKFNDEFEITFERMINEHQWVGISNRAVKRISDSYPIDRADFRGVGVEVITTYKDTDVVPNFNVATLTVREVPYRPYDEVATLRKAITETDTEISVGERLRLNLAIGSYIKVADEVMQVTDLPINHSDIIRVSRPDPVGHNTWELVYRHYTYPQEKLLSYAQLLAEVEKGDYFLTIKWVYELGRVFTC